MEWFDNISKKYPFWFLIGTGITVYFYSLFNGFVGDDFDQLVQNTFIHSLANLPYFFLGGTFNNGFVSLSGIYYKPVMTIMFSLVHTLVGPSPFFYHFVQLIFHIANAILLFFLFKKFFPRNLSYIVSLLFLIHPINTEAVSYISNLQDVLYTFFGLSGLLVIIYKKQSAKNILITYCLLLLSLLSKETGIVFIGLSLLFQLLYAPKQLMKYISATLIIVGIYAALRIHAVGLYSYHTENFPMMQLSLPERLFHIPSILFYYLKTLLFPFQLAFAQNWVLREITIQNFFLPLSVCLLVVMGIFWLGLQVKGNKQKRHLFFFFLGFLIFGLSLHLQILPLDMTVADRWFYVPFIGILGLGGILWEKFPLSKKWHKSIPYFLLGLMVLLGVLTFARSRNWESQFTLYQHDVKYNTTSYNLLNGWASELMNVGRYNEAEPYIRQSIALEPNFCYSWNNLGSVYAIRKDYAKARKYYETAIERRACVLAYNNLATLMYYHFDVEDAYRYTKKALKEAPGSSRIWLMHALIEHKRGNDEEALKAAKRSYQLNQTQAAAYVYTSLQNHVPFELKEQ